MAALFRVDARLAQRLDEVVEDQSVVVEPSKRSGPTAALRVEGSDRPVQIHSKIDPVSEAQRLADSVEIEKSFCFVVCGFGLGHHVLALFRRLKGEALLVVAEPNLQLLKLAMQTLDLSELFKSNRCVILTQADKGDVQTKLEQHNTLMMMGTKFVNHPPSERIHREFFSAMRQLLADHLSYARTCLVTLVTNSRITCRNIAHNLPTYVTTPPIDVLRDRFTGTPGIVVAAGPSLRRNIDQLAQAKGKAPIISVQTTFKTLLDRGITPDFVTSLDYHEMSKRFFENVADFEQTHLVAEPKVTWHVVDAYKGPVSIVGSDFARTVLGDELGHRATLKAGATVAHLAFYLAVYMGCDPIVLVGQDLGYSNNIYYVPGVAFHDLWRPDLNRFSTIEMKEWERIVRHRRILKKTTDINGHPIYTDEQLFTYLQQFEGDFAAVPGRVIDATEGGVRKAATRTMPLQEVIDQYCREPLPPESFRYRRELNWNDTSKLKPGRDQVVGRLEQVEKMAETCRQMISVLKELVDLLDDPRTFNRRLAEVDRLRMEVRRQEETYKMVSAVAQHAELQRFTADRQIRTEDVDGKARAQRQLDRDIRFVEAILDGCEALTNILEESRDRFDRTIEQVRG